ncbi:DUF2269 family protein [Hazenella sp. IB182357]|uniref:DUF2269 family protein n=1 Tax=Polycladospora coralii TaxID=2771432 RepID=A0A926NA87_9BACL|nr:DUF2269 family protein [Polycladospora coralii]MBD1372312.1 DUF2269 family protein [Polycladospora coralii]MBS7531498.1 DUF2269 family protein [Polycladospora coralii]
MEFMNIALFIHVVCVATWFGGATMMTMFLRDATRSNDVTTMANTLAKVQRWNLTMFLPTSVLVLITGMYMWMAYVGAESKPLWLLVKERFGSLFIIAFILIIAFYGKKLLNQVKESGVQTATAQALLKRYIMLLNFSLLCMIILIFFVTIKL